MNVNALRRRLVKLEERLGNPGGLIPHTPEWLDYWSRYFSLKWAGADVSHLSPQFSGVGKYEAVEILRAVLQNAEDSE